MNLSDLLNVVPGLYADLEDAALAKVPSEPGEVRGSGDPRSSPAPGRLEVMEHRDKLVRGLRWWVDAVRDRGEHTRVGHDVGLMARWLADHLDVMAPEDRDELRANLDAWRTRAWRLMDAGPREKGEVELILPLEAYDRVVRVKDAAEILGCTVRTVRRRVPIARREGGMVLLRDAVARCRHELVPAECGACVAARN